LIGQRGRKAGETRARQARRTQEEGEEKWGNAVELTLKSRAAERRSEAEEADGRGREKKREREREREMTESS